jgi:L-ascorbate metabolism protein UlaG (beta-lactamase superfamily)
VSAGESVSLIWFGVSTLLLDDGDTQLLIDGFFSRPAVAQILTGRISSDVANINYVMAEYQMNRLAAIIPVHSHYDHAMDVGYVANRSSAVVLGSESTANIVTGSRLPIHQYQILADRESRQFGKFEISLIVSRHAPIGVGEAPLIPGKIREPLEQPAWVSEWKEGISYSVLIAHPRGRLLVQGSGGYIKGNLAEFPADVVVLGIGGLSRLGQEYFAKYWQQTVLLTGARRVYPVHFDDFTKPFGDVQLMPRILDDVTETAAWMQEMQISDENSVTVERLPFGLPVAIF